MKLHERAEIAKFVLENLPPEILEQEIAEEQTRWRVRVFPWATIVWLMLFQRIGQGRSLSETVAAARDGACEEFYRRAGVNPEVRRGEFSSGTSGISQARARIPLKAVEAACDHLNGCLSALHREERWEGYKVYLVDGSTLTLPHSQALMKEFPSCVNQSGKSHWPVMRTCYAHDLVTGIALRPEYGPLMGDAAVSESGLLKRMLHRLEEKAVLVGDRLFGTYRVSAEIVSHGHEVAARVMDDRAKKFLKFLKKPGEVAVAWTPSAWEIKQHPELSSAVAIEGRFIWQRLKRRGYKPINLYLFTTLALPVEKIVALYGLRWQIENDIRDIKSCLDLDNITAKIPDVVRKEVILGHTAFNLVRHVIALFAKEHSLDPRSLSFRKVLYFITLVGPQIPHLTPEQIEDKFRRFERNIHQLVNKKRSRPPQIRKRVYRKSDFPFPFMKQGRRQEQRKLLKLNLKKY